MAPNWKAWLTSFFFILCWCTVVAQRSIKFGNSNVPAGNGLIVTDQVIAFNNGDSTTYNPAAAVASKLGNQRYASGKDNSAMPGTVFGTMHRSNSTPAAWRLSGIMDEPGNAQNGYFSAVSIVPPMNRADDQTVEVSTFANAFMNANDTAPGTVISERTINAQFTGGDSEEGATGKGDTVLSNGTPQGAFTVNWNNALPVNLGFMNAKVVDGMLVLKWSIVHEVNDDHFDIEVSKDGVEFIKIGTVPTKPLNGNASSVVEYNFKAHLDVSMTFAGAALFLASLILLVFYKKNRWLLAGSMCISACLVVISYGKPDSRFIGDNGNLYARLTQVDKNGEQMSPKVVRVIWE